MVCIKFGAKATFFSLFTSHQNLPHTLLCPQIHLAGDEEVSAEYTQKKALEIVREESEWEHALIRHLYHCGQIDVDALWGIVGGFLPFIPWRVGIVAVGVTNFKFTGLD